MKRGGLVVVALHGDYGKPRPAVIIQADKFNETHATLLVCPLIATLQNAPNFRIPIEPSSANGLRQQSEVMVDKIGIVRREKLGRTIGRLDEDTLAELNRVLAVFVGLSSG